MAQRRTADRLSVKGLEALLRRPVGKAAMVADGRGLYLRLRTDGDPTWVFVTTKGGTRKDIALGRVGDVTLAAAREKADKVRSALASGIAPRAALGTTPPQESEPTPVAVTFAAFAETYISSVEKGWKNPVHRAQWRQTIETHAKPLHNIPIADVSTDHVMAALEPIWTHKAETASRLRGRIEKILDAAKARGLRPQDSQNPAAFRGHLAVLLAKQPKLKRGHHKALAFAGAPAFMLKLAGRPGLAARALAFTILTAARSGEVLGARWNEIDFDRRLWTVPAERMKASVEHVVPLSPRAISLLESMDRDGDIIFGVGGAPRSNMAMSMLLRRMEYAHITVHGFRSTFRDWAGDATEYPRDLIEAALAHTITNKAERAYRRGTAIERRRGLMDAWAAFLDSADDVAALA